MTFIVRSGSPRNSGTERAAPADTRAALLSAARRLFARRGFAGASVRAITKEARVNLGAVTYHFGSKHALYDAVLDQVLTPLTERIDHAVDAGGGTLDRAEATVRALFEHLKENPDMPQLMLQEIAAGKPPPAPVARTLGAVSARLAGLVREGQSTGEIRPGDPILQALSLVYQPVHLTLIQRIGRDIMGLDQSDPATRARVVEHAAAFARAGLAARKEEV